MSQSGQRARIVHTISGRLRLRFERDCPLVDGDDAAAGPARSLAAVRLVPGVLSTELKPAARSAVIRYDPDLTGEEAILAELASNGVEVMAEDRPSPQPTAHAGSTPSPQPSPSGRGSNASGERSALMEALIGPPPKLDRRFVESIGLS